MQRIVWLGVFSVGCIGVGGGGKHHGGDGPGTTTEDTATGDSGDSGDSGEVVAPVVVTVGPDGDYPDIQSAVDAATADTEIDVAAGTWSAPVVVSGRVITVHGEGEGRTILDGGTVQVPITVDSGGWLTLEDLTVSAGYGGDGIGGGVRCQGGALSISGVTVYANEAAFGGGVGAQDCDVVIADTRFARNRSWTAGGGLYVSGGTIEVDASSFSANEGGDGGGAYVTGAPGTVSGSTFSVNDAQNGGGAWFDGETRFAGNLVESNNVVWLGGGIYVDRGSGDIVDSVFRGNTSLGDGAGAYTDYSTATLSNLLFESNVSADDAGGIRLFHGSATLVDSTFRWNESSGDGGAVKASHQKSTISNCVFEENVSANFGGGVEIDDDITYVSNSVFRGNQAREGGGLHVLEPYYDVEADGLELTDNVATDCGGGAAISPQGAVEDAYVLTLRHSVVSGNSSRSGGGLCARYGAIAAENVLLTANVAEHGGAAHVAGVGGHFTHVTAWGNETTSGGAISFDATGTGWVTDSIVAANTGGGVSVGGSGVTLTYNDAFENGVDYSGIADPTGFNGNFSEDPALVDAAGGDFHLAAGSPCVDAGDPTELDADGSASDLGAWGGLEGSW